MENPFGGKIYFKEETQTTMNDALDMVEQGAGEGCLCWSLHQTQGRGRIQGRNWHSAAGESLAFTLILSPELIKVQPSLSLRLGLGLSRYLEEEFKLDIRIKWPNDIYCMGGKLAGILCEYRRGVILAGIGLNLNQKVFPENLPRAVSLKQLKKIEDLNPQEVLGSLLPYLKIAIEEEISMDQWNKRLMYRNEAIEFLSGDPNKREKIQGTLIGISQDGALKIRKMGDKASVENFYSGEIILA